MSRNESTDEIDILMDIKEILQESRKKIEETAKDTNYQLRRIATRLEEINK